jgi:hypothetical protein
MSEQEKLMNMILERWREIEQLQAEINCFVASNRSQLRESPEFEEGYTDSIESYYVNN